MIIDLPRQNTYKDPLLLRLQRAGVARLNPYLVAKEFELLGRDVVWTSSSKFYVLGSNPRIVIDSSLPVGHSVDGRLILDDKIRYKELLAESGINVPFGRSFLLNEKNEARELCVNSQRPMVIKPSHGNKGRAVALGITSGADFEAAWENACKHNRSRSRHSDSSIIIEEQFDGMELRFLVVGAQCVGIYLKLRPSVVGNGRDSIRRLIRDTNTVKSENPTEWDKLITIDWRRRSVIRAQGRNLNSVPKNGEIVMLDYMSSASSGAHTFEITNMVHESFKELAVSAASLADGAPAVGIDMVIEDFASDRRGIGYVVLEGNSRPGLGGHHFPTYGEPNNVARHIVEYCLHDTRGRNDRDAKRSFSVLAVSLRGINRRKVENLLQTNNVKVRSISSDRNRLRIYLDERPGRTASLSKLLREKLRDTETEVFMEERRYGECIVRIVVQGRGTKEATYPEWLKHQADLRGVSSELRTLPNGRVEAILSGEKMEVGNVVLKCGLGRGKTRRKVSLWKMDGSGFKGGYAPPNDSRAPVRGSWGQLWFRLFQRAR